MPDSSCPVVQPSDAESSGSKKFCKNSRIDLGDVTPHNLKLLKKVNQVLLVIYVYPARAPLGLYFKIKWISFFTRKEEKLRKAVPQNIFHIK